MEGTAVSITLKEYKAQLEDLKGTLLTTEKGTEEYANTLQEISERQAKLNEVLQVTKSGYVAVDGSLVQMRKTLSEMTKDLNNNYVVGTKAYDEMAKKVKAYADQVKEAEAKQGVFFRNVGNYANSFTQAFQAMGMQAPQALGAVQVGLAGIEKGMSILEKHPLIALISVIVALVMGIVAVLKKCYDAFAKTEEGADKMAQVFSQLNGVGVVFDKVMQAIGAVIANVIIPVFNTFMGVISSMIEGVGLLTEGFGKLFGNDTLRKVGEDMRDVRKETEKSAEAEKQRQKLYHEANRLAVEASKKQIQINDLRAKANDRERYSIKERKKFADEAYKLERQILDAKIKNVQASLQLLKQENARAGSSKADLQKERELEIQLNNLLAERGTLARSHYQEERKFTKEQDKSNGKAEKAQQERTKAEQKYLEYLRQEEDLMASVYSVWNKKKLDAQIKAREDAYKKELIEIEKEKISEEKKNEERLSAEKKFNFDKATITKNFWDNYGKELKKYSDEFYAYTLSENRKDKDSNIQHLEEKRKHADYFYTFMLQTLADYEEERKKILGDYGDDEQEEYNRSVMNIKTLRDKELQEIDDQAFEYQMLTLKNQRDALKEYSNEWQQINVDMLDKIARRTEELGPKVGETIEQWKARVIQAWKDVDEASRNSEENASNKASASNEVSILERLMGFKISDAQAELERLAYEMKTLYYDADLESYEEYQLRKLKLQEQYNKAKDKKIKDEIKSFKSLANGLTGIFDTIQGIYEEDLNNQVKNNKITEEEAEKRFESTKKFQIATAIISMLASASGIYMDTMKDHSIQPTWLRPVLAGVQYASVLATGVAQIQKIRNSSFSSSGSGGSGGGGASGITSASVTPLIDQNLDAQSYTQLNAETNAMSGEQRVILVESDVREMNNRVQVREQSSTF